MICTSLFAESIIIDVYKRQVILGEVPDSFVQVPKEDILDVT